MRVPSDREQTLVHPKRVRTDIAGQKRLFIDRTAIPFEQLQASDLLDTRDVCRLFPCARRTVYHWVAKGLLQPSGKVGREFFFAKREVRRWLDERPRFGRPLDGL